MTNLGQEFRKVIKGYNFVTPNILGYYEIKNGIAELSEGEMFGNTIFGVTVLQNGKNMHKLSQSFHSREKAIKYIEQLNEE